MPLDQTLYQLEGRTLYMLAVLHLWFMANRSGDHPATLRHVKNWAMIVAGQKIREALNAMNMDIDRETIFT